MHDLFISISVGRIFPFKLECDGPNSLYGTSRRSSVTWKTVVRPRYDWGHLSRSHSGFSVIFEVTSCR